MSTPTVLLAHEGKALVRWRPEGDESLNVRREVWMPPSLRETIEGWTCGARADSKRARVCNEDVRGYLLDFIAGGKFDVGVLDDRCDLKALTPPAGHEYAAWEMRIEPHDPHTRIFGVFITPQDFLAMSCRAKRDLRGPAQDAAALGAKSQAVTLVGQKMWAQKTRPFAKDLGGTDYGYEDYFAGHED